MLQEHIESLFNLPQRTQRAKKIVYLISALSAVNKNGYKKVKTIEKFKTNDKSLLDGDNF